METKRFIFIDATNKTVSEVFLTPELSSYYKQIGCELIEACYPQRLAPNHFLYVDEEGGLKDNYVWSMDGYPQQLLAGNALVCCNNDEGAEVDCTMSVSVIHQKVLFIGLRPSLF